jgi:DNA-binding NarL/FixJ family response regulator
MKQTRQITVLLADDHAPVRQGLRTLLDNDAQILVVGEARNGREAVDMARKARPDVVLMDISMPIMNGLEATREILAELPSTKIIVLSAQTDEAYVERAMALGAVGYISKQKSAETLTWSIREVAMGRSLRHPSKAEAVLAEEGPAHEQGVAAKGNGGRLTHKESELLKLVAEGVSKKTIAARLRMTLAVLERHLAVLMAKLGIASIAKLSEYAVASGHVENDVELVII